jgi:hypothetical protein
MAFSLRNLSVLAYANGFTLWLYKSNLADQAQVAAPDFFEDAGDMFAAGDILMVAARDGARMLCVRADGNRLLTAPLV